MQIFTDIIARELQLPTEGIANTIQLLDEGCTIPFIARYRKERTGGLTDEQVAEISIRYGKLKEMAKRKETIIATIEAQGKLTDEIKGKIDNCWDANVLEDLYLPFKPKRRTRAQTAREMGLEPLAAAIMLQRDNDIESTARRLISGKAFREQLQKMKVDANTFGVTEALNGAKDIIAENVSEDEECRNILRHSFRREATITSKVVKSKAETDEAQKYSDYFNFSEPLSRCNGNRLLAMRRGEADGILNVRISVDGDYALQRIQRRYVRGRGRCAQLVGEAIDDSYKRLLTPSMENEFATASREKAEAEAIEVFARNLKQLLLDAPLGQKRVMGVDPGIRTGCKVVMLDAQGNLLHHDVVYTFPPKGDSQKATATFTSLARKYNIEAVAVGNGTASRETTDILKRAMDDMTSVDKPHIYVVSEDGASVYSASKTARDEFPDEDVTVRGAVSIARRLMDPLAELVKIDPKSIGVGQYQHDVDQTQLKRSLDMTVESCVNMVGVNPNTASQQLLTYVSGLGPVLAKNIVEYRKANGNFTSRAQLKKVPRLGPNTFTQCAGFLRIPDARNPLDNTAVHPERYDTVKTMAADCGCTVAELIKDKARLKSIDLKRYVTADMGLPTLNDIISELEKPGRDPRGQVEVFDFDNNVHTVDDVRAGMLLPGIVTNLTKFGAFVDIGVHQDGLIHISQMADRYISDPSEVLRLHQHVMVSVLDVDTRRNRISLKLERTM